MGDITFWETFAGGAILFGVYLILKMIFGFIEKLIDKLRTNNGKRSLLNSSEYIAQKHIDVLEAIENIDWKQQESFINDMWKWHNHRDEDGVPLWYVRRSIGENIKDQAIAINRLSYSTERIDENIAKNTKVLEQLVSILNKTTIVQD